ncbi:MAG TPA: asparagine synthase (glutamine-hydrolyzing), partial [Aggregatilineaceae bacterium]|nr:asparagine synthase (glutamine-hydrolyzing) [Aggregatilineaceae bacterium]
MCGICGIVHRDPTYLFSENQLTGMRDSFAHRGPDDVGQYLPHGVALGSRRLAILDLSEQGHMPMSTPDGRYWITYNGEVYNYRDFYPPLMAKGYTFRSHGDTEVLLSLYIDRGPAMLDELNGMFAFAIWDDQERTLFIARDRLGIKPLYYAHYDGALYFGSEEKALFAAGVPRSIDPETWEELFYFRYVAGERTPFAGVRRLLPGHYMLWKDGHVQITRWWNLSQRAQLRRESTPSDVVGWYRETFDNAVSLRRISDVPVGVLLSGGLDSSSVAASLADQAEGQISSFTVGFTEDGFDESSLALDVAKRWHLDFHRAVVTPDQLFDYLLEASWINDEPLMHGNDAHLLAISKYAKPRVTVLLSGEGADETLGGYVRYQPLHYASLFGMGRPVMQQVARFTDPQGRLNKLSRFLSLGSVDRFVLFNACDVLPTELGFSRQSKNGGALPHFGYREQVLTEAKQLYPHDPVRQAMYSDQHIFLCSLLDRNDRMTMGASIECRVPFLDYRLVETLAALPTTQFITRTHSKDLLRQALGWRLPESILSHRKWGFSVP